MSGLERNKITAAILLSSLIAMIVGIASNVLYRPNLEVSERGYQIEITAQETSAAENIIEDIPIDIDDLISKANASAGAKAIRKCITCHTIEKAGANKIGPNLWQIVGAKKAHLSNYIYSKALSNLGGNWDYKDLFYFLQKPSKFIPGTRMSFIGIKKPQEIADIIAYLKQISNQ